MLKIIERMRLYAVRKKKLAELMPRQRKFLLWARGITLLDFYENLKARLHSMNYPPVYSCYTGIDWKTGKKLEEAAAPATAAVAAEPDALSELVAGGGSNPEPAAAAAPAPASEGAGGGGSVLASAGSTVCASQSSPRV